MPPRTRRSRRCIGIRVPKLGVATGAGGCRSRRHAHRDPTPDGHRIRDRSASMLLYDAVYTDHVSVYYDADAFDADCDTKDETWNQRLAGGSDSEQTGMSESAGPPAVGGARDVCSTSCTFFQCWRCERTEMPGGTVVKEDHFCRRLQERLHVESALPKTPFVRLTEYEECRRGSGCFGDLHEDENVLRFTKEHRKFNGTCRRLRIALLAACFGMRGHRIGIATDSKPAQEQITPVEQGGDTGIRLPLATGDDSTLGVRLDRDVLPASFASTGPIEPEDTEPGQIVRGHPGATLIMKQSAQTLHNSVPIEAKANITINLFMSLPRPGVIFIKGRGVAAPDWNSN